MVLTLGFTRPRKPQHTMVLRSTIVDQRGSVLKKTHCIVSAFDSSSIHWSRVFQSTSPSGTTHAYDVECSNIVAYDYGVRIIGVIDHDDAWSGYSTTPVRLFWENSTYHTANSDGVFFLDLSLNGSLNDLNVVDQSGNKKCKNPDIWKRAYGFELNVRGDGIYGHVSTHRWFEFLQQSL